MDCSLPPAPLPDNDSIQGLLHLSGCFRAPFIQVGIAFGGAWVANLRACPTIVGFHRDDFDFGQLSFHLVSRPSLPYSGTSLFPLAGIGHITSSHTRSLRHFC